jgi:hypothetical protein
MFKPAFARLATFFLFLSFLIVLAFNSRSAGNNRNVESGLVVHEWGTFTSVTNKNGSLINWRPLSVESDLPSFIYSVDKGQSWKGLRYRTKSAMSVRVRMETPVLYFYAKEETTATVKVGFPDGQITEWYPRARSVSPGIDWGQVKIMPGLRVELPHDAQENHYYPARETDAAILQVPGESQLEHEKFLFYRGVGDFALPISIKPAGDKLVIRNLSQHKIARAVLFENKAGQIGYRLLNLDQAELNVERPVLGMRLSDLRQELRSLLVANGLFEKEADAMLNTWRDSWFEEGLRLFYIVPREDTDAILPLKIDPAPVAIVRVLVGRTELITPDMEKDVTSQLRKLQNPSLAVQAAARKEIKRYGRFVESILSQISLSATDPEVKSAVSRLLAEMN